MIESAIVWHDLSEAEKNANLFLSRLPCRAFFKFLIFFFIATQLLTLQYKKT